MGDEQSENLSAQRYCVCVFTVHINQGISPRFKCNNMDETVISIRVLIPVVVLLLFARFPPTCQRVQRLALLYDMPLEQAANRSCYFVSFQ